VSDKLRCKNQKCDISQSGGHSGCTVLTVTVRVGSDPYRRVTEVTYDIGNSVGHSECTVLTVTVSARSDPSGNETEVMYAT
jgi:hypothetical protein